ncbi:MAG: KH domain-containing protein [Actinobacteria bacterium]|nr:MAG: KH domain-containing protein [Actinomycetota bacterium]
MREVLEYVAKALVDDPEAVTVTEVEGDVGLVLRLEVGPEDVGKVIGRQGRTARAIRDVVRASGTKSGSLAQVEIVG